MMKRTALTFAIAYGLLVGSASAVEIFDFEGAAQDGAAWNGSITESSNSGNYTLKGSGSIQENTTTVFVFQNGPDPDGTIIPISAPLTIEDGSNVGQSFTVNSFDWRAGDFNGGATAAMIGYSGGAGGTEQWRLEGPFNLSPAITHTAPTTGSFANSIDTIVWSIPDYGDNAFGHTLDNLSVNIDSVIPEPTSALLALGAVAGLALRRRS